MIYLAVLNEATSPFLFVIICKIARYIDVVNPNFVSKKYGKNQEANYLAFLKT